MYPSLSSFPRYTHTAPPERGPRNELRVDPHPAWGPRFQRVAFNGCPDGTRRVYMAELGDRVAAVEPGDRVAAVK